MSTLSFTRPEMRLQQADGEYIVVPREVFVALNMLMGAGKPAGSVTITCKNGGVAGVEIAMKTVLK